MCALNADRSCRAQLLIEHSYPFSHYCLLYVRFTRTRGNLQRIYTFVCTAWPRQKAGLLLRNTCLLYTEQEVEQTNYYFFLFSYFTLQMSSDMSVNTAPREKLLRHVQSARIHMDNLFCHHKTQMRCFSCVTVSCCVPTCRGTANKLLLTDTSYKQCLNSVCYIKKRGGGASQWTALVLFLCRYKSSKHLCKKKRLFFA